MPPTSFTSLTSLGFRAALRQPAGGRAATANLLHTTATLSDPSNKPKPLQGPMPTESDEDPATDPSKGGEGFFGSLLYGSKEAKAEGLIAHSNNQGQHSKLVGRGKYVHEKITHAIIPSRREEYLEAAEKYFTTLIERGNEFGGVKVTGSWEATMGAVGNFVHILEYENYKGYDETCRAQRASKELTAIEAAIFPHITSRQHQLMSEFSFWPSSPPRDSGYPNGGIFELRSYQLQPGKLLDWEHAWRRGMEARKRFVQPVGAFFSQVGQLHEVHHIWQYPDMHTRKVKREQAWTVGSWSDTVQETVKLTQSMKSTIMVPTSWSPLR